MRVVALQIEGLILLPPTETRRWRKNRIEDWGLNSPVVHQIIEADREGLDVEAFTLLGEEYADDAERRLERDRVPAAVRFAANREVLWEYERNVFLIHHDPEIEFGFFVDAPELFDLYQAITRYR